jgi:PhnB protein
VTVNLDPYVNFRGDARAALEHYHSVFGGDLRVSTYQEFGAAQDPAEEDLVMHGQLEGEHGLRLMASDTPSRMEYRPGSNFSLSLSGDDEPLLRGWFEQLSDGGQVLQPLAKAPWGDSFGMCADRFGITWLVNISGQPG